MVQTGTAQRFQTEDFTEFCIPKSNIDLGKNKITTTSATSWNSNELIPKSYADALVTGNSIADDSITNIKIHDLNFSKLVRDAIKG